MADQKPFQVKLAEFIGKYRVAFGIISAAIVLAIIAVVVVTEVSRNQQDALAWELHLLEEEYADLESGESPDIDRMLEVIDKYSFPEKSYPWYRQHFMHGVTQEMAEEYEVAAESFDVVAESSGYLSDIALLKSALNSELAGDIDSAMEKFQRLVEERESPEEPRVLFTLGRLSEGKDDFAKAAEYYNRLIDENTASNWANFAQNRLIALEIEGKISAE